MTQTRPPKKSEVLEIRLSHETKRALMDRARGEGKPASHILREFIELYLEPGARAPDDETPEGQRTPFRLTHVKPMAIRLVGVAAAVAVGLAVAPANAVPHVKAAFDLLDRDGDGGVTLEEYSTPPDVKLLIGGTIPGGAGALPLPGPAALSMPLAPEGATIAMVPLPPPPAGPLPFVAKLPMVSAPDGSGIGVSAEAEFGKADTNADGRLTYGEFEARHRTVMAEAFADIDRDGNGTVTAQELTNAASGANGTLTLLDGDGDRVLTFDEFLSLGR